jgi:hypothetical protein
MQSRFSFILEVVCLWNWNTSHKEMSEETLCGLWAVGSWPLKVNSENQTE